MNRLQQWVNECQALWVRLQAVHQRRKRPRGGDWYDTLNDTLSQLIRDLDEFRGRSRALDQKIDEVQAKFDSCLEWPNADDLKHLESCAPNPDGPIPSGFLFEGEVYQLTAKPHHLLCHLWEQPKHACSWDDLAEPVWGDRASDLFDGEKVRSVAKRLNNFFVGNALPWKVKTRQAPPPPIIWLENIGNGNGCP